MIDIHFLKREHERLNQLCENYEVRLVKKDVELMRANMELKDTKEKWRNARYDFQICRRRLHNTKALVAFLLLVFLLEILTWALLTGVKFN